MAAIRKRVIYLNILALAIWLFQLIQGHLADYLISITKATRHDWLIPILSWTVPVIEITAVMIVLVLSIALYSNLETKEAVKPKTLFILPIVLPLMILANELMVVFAYVLIMNW